MCAFFFYKHLLKCLKFVKNCNWCVYNRLENLIYLQKDDVKPFSLQNSRFIFQLFLSLYSSLHISPATMLVGTAALTSCPLLIFYTDIRKQTKALNMWMMKMRKKQNFKNVIFSTIRALHLFNTKTMKRRVWPIKGYSWKRECFEEGKSACVKFEIFNGKHKRHVCKERISYKETKIKQSYKTIKQK